MTRVTNNIHELVFSCSLTNQKLLMLIKFEDVKWISRNDFWTIRDEQITTWKAERSSYPKP